MEMDEKKILTNIDKTVLTGIELGVFEDRLGRKLFILYHHGIADRFVVKMIDNRVAKAVRRDPLNAVTHEVTHRATHRRTHSTHTPKLLGFRHYGQ